MNAPETLARSKACHQCGGEIPSGTPLSALEWDQNERAWAHRKPSCAEAGQAFESGPAVAGSYTPSPTIRATRAVGVPDDPARGAWSVTMEVHEAQDPARSKLVLRIARLHLGTYAEAWAVAEQLRAAPRGNPP